jgi:hypothetical protein
VNGAGFRSSVATWRSGRVKQRTGVAPSAVCRVRRTTAGQQPAQAGRAARRRSARSACTGRVRAAIR